MKQLRVLMQNRANAFTQRGGDTVVMEKLRDGLTKRGVHVTIDTECTEDPAGYDVVHLLNFALPDLLRHLAEKAHKKGVPYVVTTLLEDIENFHNQSIVCGNILIEYVRSGQNRRWLEDKWETVNSIHKSTRFVNDWVAQNAACLFSNGAAETRTIRRQYGESPRVREIKLGYEIGVDGDPQQFIRECGVKDFVFCVGRLETRKNQLMLLKALEDEDIPVVFAAGGFTYQPDYADAVRNFKRKGQTIVLDKLTPEMLAAAYRASRVHALPSWYELPGLVSLEAGYFGAQLLATDRGTSIDYLADKAFYCQPDNEESIRNGVLAAYYGSGKSGVKDWVSQYTWDTTVDSTLNSYEEITGRASAAARTPASAPMYDMSSSVTEFQELLEKGEIAARNREFEVATRCFEKAEALGSSSTRLLRARGAVLLAQSDHTKAQGYFERTLSLDSKDPKAWSGLGMCEMMNKRIETAYGHFVKSLDLSPNQLVPILQLMECSYALGRFDDLERILRKFVSDNPTDVQMKFCLAGCLYKLGRWDEARQWNDWVLSEDPNHNGGNELKTLLAAEGTQPSLRSNIEREASSNSSLSFTSVDQVIGDIEDDKRRRDFDQAKAKLTQLMARTDLSPAQRERVRTTDAELVVVSGDWDEAERRFDLILADNPNNARAACGKGAIWVARGDWEKAKGHFEEAAAKDSRCDVAFAGLGLWEQHKGSKESAWEWYSKAIAINPENSRALLGMIELGYSMKKYGELQQVIEQYLEMHPGDLDFIYALAGCLYIQDKLSDAKRELDKISLFEPAHVKANELRGIIETKLGEQRV